LTLHGGNLLLAYVFWHWRQSAIAAPEYEGRQRAFHSALAAAPPPGFAGSFSVALPRAPWPARGDPTYEDWYLVDDFAAFGTLNEAAVTASRAAPHDAAAAVAAGGAGGAYGVRFGTIERAPKYAHWFAKPEGMSYNKLFGDLAPLVARVRGVLWMRQMVLGPASEFCVHCETPVDLPAGFRVLTLPLRQIWPERSDSDRP
jgi:hypothetical protein